jgi:hypothetical protein
MFMALMPNGPVDVRLSGHGQQRKGRLDGRPLILRLIEFDQRE